MYMKSENKKVKKKTKKNYLINFIKCVEAVYRAYMYINMYLCRRSMIMVCCMCTPNTTGFNSLISLLCIFQISNRQQQILIIFPVIRSSMMWVNITLQ